VPEGNNERETKEISMTALPRWTLAALLTAATCAPVLPAAAQSVEAFYKSHELTILIGHPPGGSTTSMPSSPPPISANTSPASRP
jgi:hypothetical protein